MIIVGTFYQSVDLEIALSQIEKEGIPAEEMMVVFMNEHLPNRSKKRDIKEIHSSAFEIGIAFATGLTVIGASIGFKFLWGPILTGLLAAIIGFVTGYSSYYFANRKKARTTFINSNEVTLIIQCSKEQRNEIHEILWNHHALSVGMRERKEQ